jgi:hypothetical protein
VSHVHAAWAMNFLPEAAPVHCGSRAAFLRLALRVPSGSRGLGEGRTAFLLLPICAALSRMLLVSVTFVNLRDDVGVEIAAKPQNIWAPAAAG